MMENLKYFVLVNCENKLKKCIDLSKINKHIKSYIYFFFVFSSIK